MQENTNSSNSNESSDNPGPSLSVREGSSIIAGLGIGGGIMAVPYLLWPLGLLPGLLILGLAFFCAWLLHLMVAEICIRARGERQLVEIFAEYLFAGRVGGVFTWIFFSLIFLSFLFLLAAYLLGAGEALARLSGFSPTTSELLFYLFAATPALLGLRGLGLSEKYGVAFIGLALIVLSLLTLYSLNEFTHEVPLWPRDEVFLPGLTLFAMVMLGFYSIFSIPQAFRGLGPVQLSVALRNGLFINLTFMLTVVLMTLISSPEVTRVALLGWGAALGATPGISVQAIGQIFTLLAFLTSYWSISFALAIVLQERLKVSYRFAWLLATFPVIIIALSGGDFLSFLRLAGGAVGLLTAFLVVPTLRALKRQGDTSGVPREVFWTTSPFQALVIIACLLMLVGALL